MPKTPAADPCNLLRLVRSIQRREGKNGCFGLYNSRCGHQVCPWKEFCINWRRKGTEERPAGEAYSELESHKR